MDTYLQRFSRLALFLFPAKTDLKALKLTDTYLIEEVLELMIDYDNNIESRQLHVALARLMEITNTIYKNKDTDNDVCKLAYSYLVRGLYPYCPHLASEVWTICFNEDMHDH